VSNFEERLLHELRSVAEAQPAAGSRRHGARPGRRLALAGGLVAVVAAAAVAGALLLSAGTQAAYAVSKNADGTVTVEIDSLTDAAGLQSKLQEAGVNAVVAYLPEGKMCQRPWFTPLGRPVGGTTRSGVEYLAGGGVRFTLGADIPADATVVIETQTGPGNETALGIAYAQGDVPPCQVVDAPAGSGPLGGPPTPGGSTGPTQG
jgi:hypothetical protein